MSADLRAWLDRRGAYEGYTYSYPHKTAYRPFDEPVPLDELWSDEDKSALFLYLHVPFCEMRCGFCNLFTQLRPEDDIVTGYLEKLEVQAARVREALGDVAFARVAFGGGTPTWLDAAGLERCFDVVDSLGAAGLPFGMETSPETATDEKLALARDRGVQRISIGLQSFFDEELKSLGRPTTVKAGLAALERIRASGLPTLNIDLIYGAGGQTKESWLSSIRTALSFEPEELFLYPLYVRPLTGLGRRGEKSWDDVRLDLYRAGRDVLLEEGYEQVSMRFFRRGGAPAGPAYRCQEDGMVGLGCGARSYTRELHYSDEWAVSAGSVREIIARWVEREPDSFAHAHYGVRLSEGEQRTRYLLQSLLHGDGLDLARYRARFGTDVLEDRPELRGLLDEHAAIEDDTLRLTARGFELSDTLGPWLYSEDVRAGMKDFDLK
jgi:oxygen-independent coproporphyrinogen-3 oxidase